jgi:hypothetical protein
MLYGQWQFSVGCFWESMRQGGKGDPEYLLPEKDFLAGPDPTLVACQENDGILSMDGYQQAMWGVEPFYKRNPDGSLKLADGKPVFNDAKETTAYGWKLPHRAAHVSPASPSRRPIPCPQRAHQTLSLELQDRRVEPLLE